MTGKTTLFYIVVSVLVICSLVGLLKGYLGIWAIWRIPTMIPHFADARVLTAGAESRAMGYDPLYINPQDPWQRPMNYPRVIQHLLALLHVNQNHTTLIGSVFIVLFFAGVFLFLGEISNHTALVLVFVIFSPAVVLGIERANYDLAIFFLVALALCTSGAPLISTPILMLAAFSKFFPVFAAGYFFKYAKRTQLILFGGFVTVFTVYLFLNYPDLQQIFNSTEKSKFVVLAYGAQTIPPASILSYLPVAALTISSLAFCLNAIAVHRFEHTNLRYIDSFRAGGGIYVGTFLLGNNWSYRLMFLIFTVPQLMLWNRDQARLVISRLALVCILISCWSPWSLQLSNMGLVKAADEIANWVLFATFLYLLMSTMPAPFQKALHRLT